MPKSLFLVKGAKRNRKIFYPNVGMVVYVAISALGFCALAIADRMGKISVVACFWGIILLVLVIPALVGMAIRRWYP